MLGIANVGIAISSGDDVLRIIRVRLCAARKVIVTTQCAREWDAGFVCA